LQQQQVSDPALLQPIKLGPLPPRPLVSVLITNYNYEDFLGDAIESVLRQTYERLEVIVCDDGSTDRSLERAEAYAKRDDRVRVVAQENRGHFAALNRAYASCRGDVVCVLDADDYFRADKVQCVLDRFREIPDAGMVVHRLGRIDERGKERGVYPLGAALPEGWLGPDVVAKGGFLQWIQTSMICLRSEVAARIFPLDTELSDEPEIVLEGPDIILRAAAALLAPIAVIDKPLAYYRLHGGNQGNSARRFTTNDLVGRRREEIRRFGGVYTSLRSWAGRELPTLNLPEFESTRPFLERRYVIARLTRQPRGEQRRLRESLLGLDETMTPTLAGFYRVSLWLPLPLFKSGLDLLYGQSRLKVVLGALKDILLRRSHPRRNEG